MSVSIQARWADLLSEVLNAIITHPQYILVAIESQMLSVFHLLKFLTRTIQ